MHTSTTFSRLFPGLDPSEYAQSEDPDRTMSLPDLPPSVYSIGQRMSYPAASGSPPSSRPSLIMPSPASPQISRPPHISTTLTRLFPGVDPSVYAQSEDRNRSHRTTTVSGSPPSYLPSSKPTDRITPSPASPQLSHSPYARDSEKRAPSESSPSPQTTSSLYARDSEKRAPSEPSLSPQITRSPYAPDSGNRTSEPPPRYSQVQCRYSTMHPIPLHIKTTVQGKYINEDGKRTDFDYLRYTAIQEDPDDFRSEKGYGLRPDLFGHDTEALVCVPFAGGDVEVFARTLHSVIESVRELSFLKPSSYWNMGAPAWQKVVVCVIVDGMDAFDERVLGLFAALGVYQDRIMVQEKKGATEKLSSSPIAAHLFECTSTMPVTLDGKPVQPTTTDLTTLAPVQLMLCIKAHKTGRTESCRWAFGAFARILEPNIIVNVDTGIYLYRSAILQLWKEFYKDPLLGGATGALSPDLGRYCRALFNPLVAAQNFESRAVSRLEAIMETTTGYMSLFPESFFAYRYDPYWMELLADRHRRLMGSDEFKREPDDERLLPSKMVLHKGRKWRTGLFSSVRANRDVPTSVASLVEQQCHDLWQTWTKSFDLFSKTASLRKTTHSIPRQCAILVQMVHNIHAWLLLWFSLSGCLLTTFLINDATGSPPSTGFPFGSSTHRVNEAIQIVYVCFLLLQFVLALSHRPQRFAIFYTLSMVVFSLIQIYTLINLVHLAKHLVDYRHAEHVDPLKLTKHPGGLGPDISGTDKYQFTNRYYTDIGPATVITTLIAVFGVYAATALANLDPWHLVTSWAQYLILWSAKVNVLNTAAICNLYRGSNTQGPSLEEALEQAETKTAHAGRPRLKTALVVAAYVLCNLAVCLATFVGDGAYWRKIWFLRVWMWANASLLLVRGAAMVWFMGGRMVGPRV